MPLPRVLEPEVMDTEAEAVAYDSMDHAEVNRRFVLDLLAFAPRLVDVLDLGTGTARIPIELCRAANGFRVMAVDAAGEMLQLARFNCEVAGLTERIQLCQADAKRLPFATGMFPVVVSNSIVHHIPRPELVVGEAVRVLAPGGAIFFRDLMRPETDFDVTRLVDLHAAGADEFQRKMFDDSLRAALSLEEIRAMVSSLGFSPSTVQATSDRHWTWAATKPGV